MISRRVRASRGSLPPTQPYHLVLVGEKDSLADALGSVAQRHRADLYLGDRRDLRHPRAPDG